MARYLGPSCKLSRRENFDLETKSGVKALWEAESASKCKRTLPGSVAGKRLSKPTDFAIQLRAKQLIKRLYGVLEKAFRNYYKKASRMAGSTGENLLVLLERRLDNVVYRMGFASTRAEARQLVSHKGIQVNGELVNVPSYLVAAGDVIAVREKSKGQLRIDSALKLSEQRKTPEWIDVDIAAKSGTFKRVPDRSELAPELNENLVVELYSK